MSADTKQSCRPRTLVTGAAVRVGRATAEEFARRGHDVVLAVRARTTIAEASVELVRKAAHDAGYHDAKIELAEANFDDPDAVVAMASKIAMHPLDVVVHCASRYDARAIGQIDAEHALSHFRINALAPLLLTQSLAPRLAQSALPNGGAVVCFTDMHASGRIYAKYASYFASKGALNLLVESLAVELAPSIRVNGIAPGVVEWPVNSDVNFQARYIERTPMKRAGTALEAAKCAAWLALDASFITGTIVYLDGGRRLAT